MHELFGDIFSGIFIPNDRVIEGWRNMIIAEKGPLYLLLDKYFDSQKWRTASAENRMAIVTHIFGGRALFANYVGARALMPIHNEREAIEFAELQRAILEHNKKLAGISTDKELVRVKTTLDAVEKARLAVLKAYSDLTARIGEPAYTVQSLLGLITTLVNGKSYKDDPETEQLIRGLTDAIVASNVVLRAAFEDYDVKGFVGVHPGDGISSYFPMEYMASSLTNIHTLRRHFETTVK